jgi:hypothetical protein
MAKVVEAGDSHEEEKYCGKIRNVGMAMRTRARMCIMLCCTGTQWCMTPTYIFVFGVVQHCVPVQHMHVLSHVFIVRSLYPLIYIYYIIMVGETMTAVFEYAMA